MKACSVENCPNIHYCKGLCRSHYNKQYKQNNEEKIKQYNITYKQNHDRECKEYEKQYASSDKGRFNKAKSKAKVRDLEFSLTYEQFIEISSKPCYYCQDELCGKENFQGAHLDRIDNSKGYTLENVISCGLLCNKIRMNNLTVEETKDAIVAILDGRKRRNYFNGT